MKIGFLFILSLFMAVGSSMAFESIYTELSDKNCPIVSQEETTDSTKQICPGVGGYKLALLYDDSRMSINIISPDGKEHELNYWGVVTGRFSNLGPKAEWRVKQNKKIITPVALIVRVNAYEDDNNPKQATSYLAVAKVTPKEICVTDKIAPMASANEIARGAADISGSKGCLPEF